MKKKGYVSLDYLIQNMTLDLNETGTVHYQRYLQWAVRGVKQIGFWTGTNLRAKYLPVGDNKIVQLPDDYQDYIKVGLCVKHGDTNMILTLAHNKDLCLVRDTDKCGDPLETALDNIDNEGYWPSYYWYNDTVRHGQYVGGVYGLGGGFTRNYFKIDEEYGQIRMDSDVDGDQVLLEYISTGIEPDGDAMIPQRAVETLLAWIHWKRKLAMKLQGTKGISERDVAMREREYLNELKNLRKIETKFSAQEYLDTVRSTYKQTPKR